MQIQGKSFAVQEQHGIVYGIAEKNRTIGKWDHQFLIISDLSVKITNSFHGKIILCIIKMKTFACIIAYCRNGYKGRAFLLMICFS